MKAKFVKVKQTDDPLNWWNHKGVVGQTFEVLEISEYNYGKIEYCKGFYGWLPLDMHEINPHLKLISLS